MGSRRRSRRRRLWWQDLPPEDLLDVRLCDLGLRIEGSIVESRIERLRSELAAQGLRFRPYVWLSFDWFTPEGATGFAIPFYLAHPRLVRLEHSQMFDVEGGTHDECMKLLRHEAAHAIDNAYLLHWRGRWRRTFGRYSAPYHDDYHVVPTSRDFVHNLDHWYAQSHPAEDWAETFAVWLRPESDWRRTYEGWPALRKLERVDAMMREVCRGRPEVRTREREESLPRLRMTLREYYGLKKALYHTARPWRHDRELLALFHPRSGRRELRAATFLRRHRAVLRARVAATTRTRRYIVDQALLAIEQRCRELDLRVGRRRDEAQIGAAVLVTLVTLAYTNGGRPRFRR